MRGIHAAIVGGSALILVVLALRLTLRNQLPRRIFPALWCAAALRLLLPVEIPTRLSVWNLLREPSAAQNGGAISQTLTPFPALAQAVPAAPTQSGTAVQANWLLLIWAVCAALLAAYFAIGYACMVRRFRGKRIAPQPSIDALLDRFHFPSDPRICATKNRRAPLTFGVRRPTVLLPDDLRVGEAEFQLVLAHELAHIRRRDCLRKVLMTVCLCLYWWNPLVWAMVHLANRDMELACDEAVLRTLGPKCRKAYALTLLAMAQRNPKPAPLCSGFAKSSAEERVHAILKFRRVPVRAGVAAALAFVMAAGALATQAAPLRTAEAQPPQREQIVQQTEPETVQPAEEGETRMEAAVQAPEKALMDAEQLPAYVWPLENDAAVSRAFGASVHPVTGHESFHWGVDLDAAHGQSVLAVAEGIVIDAGFDQAYGYHVTIEHPDGMQTMYAHLSSYPVEVGDTVVQGGVIGYVGATGWATGPHLHLAVRIDGEYVDPLTALGSAVQTGSDI